MQTTTREIISEKSETAANPGITHLLPAPAVLSLTGAGLLTCAVPGPDFGWLAWIAIVPLIIACEDAGVLAAAGLGFLFGMASNVGIYRWLFEVNGFRTHHFLILSTYFSLYPLAWCAGISFFKRHRLSLIFAAPAFWITLDCIRAHAGFMAFPWGTLAQTQHKNLAILQVATIAGEYGITFLVVLGNTVIAEIVRRFLSTASDFPPARWVLVAALLIALAHVWGAYEIYTATTGPTIRVAAVQPSIPIGERETPEGRTAVMRRLERLTRVAAGSHPALIVWPETAIAGSLRANPLFAAGFLELAREVKTPIISGVGEVEKFAMRDAQGKMLRRAYNSAYLLTPDEPLGDPYIKRVLLPFGEYVPLENLTGWPAWLAPPVFNTVVGDKPYFFTLRNGIVGSPLICWENLFSSLGRESVRGGARLLVLLTNDGWFGRSAEPYQHNLASVLRAVENRVPVVVSSNTGPSQIIDPYGRIVSVASGIFREDVIVGDITAVSAGTLYTKIGDLFTVIVVLSLGTAIVRGFLNERAANEGNP
ncbi:MAG TPA: apolipoprotein N-acyltransferase [Candidatus Binatia bacterium]